ncbi:hypothetical protein C1E23_18365 [Pseudoalteromonas phenolica]|uniref:Uncharacterized protein n=1 Tax=Pseudoalteromonas phenolica TaxID=161398 RepID=A0A4Q7IJW0_9GAMM|nr:hypothetical protein [Pseudoalteromonas phenolica]RZQ51689.1 hypothetical protein C1E23_18365 [Pseudoalteromonas phenolica]
MRVVLCFFLLFSGASFSNNLYKHGSNCEVVEGSKTIKFQAETRKVVKSFDKNEELMEKIRKRLYEKVSTRIAEYESDFVVKKASFNKRAWGHLIGFVEIIPVNSCKDPSVIITENNQHLITDNSFSYSMALNPNPISLNLSIDNTSASNENGESEEKESIFKSQELLNMTVSPENILGISIGDSFEHALNNFGRFSLVWPLENNYKLALIGRKNAFLFKDNVLVQYQYSPSLLPVKLRNIVEMSELDVEFKTPSRTIKESSLLTDIDLHELSQLYGDVSFKTLIIGDMEKEQALKSLVIGGDENHTLTSSLECLNEKDLNNSILQNENKLVKLVSYMKKRAFLSGCNQLVFLNSSKEARELTLLEDWGNMNSELIDAKELFDSFKPWQFLSLAYGDSIAHVSKLGSVSMEDEVIDFKSSSSFWEGSFVTEQKKVVSANLIPIRE